MTSLVRSSRSERLILWSDRHLRATVLRGRKPSRLYWRVLIAEARKVPKPCRLCGALVPRSEFCVECATLLEASAVREGGRI